MGLFGNFKKAEVRSLENPNAPVSAENFLRRCQNKLPCPTVRWILAM